LQTKLKPIGYTKRGPSSGPKRLINGNFYNRAALILSINFVNVRQQDHAVQLLIETGLRRS